MNAVAKVRMDKTVFEVCSLHEQGNALEYWMSKTPQERLEHVELLRQLNCGDAVGYYGYARATGGIDMWIDFNPNNLRSVVSV